MSTWGTGCFESDAAQDFLTQLLQSDDLQLLTEALETGVEAPEGTLEEAEGARAIAAAEIVARLRGYLPAPLPPPTTPPAVPELIDLVVRDEPGERPELPGWIQARAKLATPALAKLALKALDRVMQPPSELLELWTEPPGNITWQNALEELRGRLKAGA
ncbi:MAG: DUF4259 domain-containing protein [Planctomycetota bacterium]